MPVTLDCTNAPFVRCGKNLNSVLAVAILVATNANEAMVAPMVGSGGVFDWRESGVRRSVLCWCVWQEFGFSRREDVFIFNLVYEEIL
jgi:hypothetical protein